MGKQFTEQDSLKVINEMISVAKGNLEKGAGKYFILWGYIVLFASILHFGSLLKNEGIHFPISGNAWFYAYIIGFVITIYFIIKDRKQKRISTYTGSIISNIWIGFAASCILLNILLSGKTIIYVYPSIMFVYTFALSISARAYRLNWMYIPVTICIAGLISYKFITPIYYPLPMAVAMLCGNIIPGHILNKIAKDQNV